MATATARLDAPRLAALVGAALVVVLASSARPDEAPEPSVATRVIAPEPTPATEPSASTRIIAPEPTPAPEPSVSTRIIAPEPTPAPEPSVAARIIAPEPTPSPTPALDTPEPSTWTSLEIPRALTIRGRQLGFASLDSTDGRLTGERADGPFAPRGPTLLVHYASWCLPCVEELPEVLALARSLADISKSEMLVSGDISRFETNAAKSPRPRPARPPRRPTIVFVSHDEAAGPQALLASFEDLLAKARLTPNDLPPGLSLRADPDGRFFDALTRARHPIPDPSALPSLWLLDRRGRLLAHLSGPLTASNRGPLLAALEALR